jgi:hypothetical protein
MRPSKNIVNGCRGEITSTVLYEYETAFMRTAPMVKSICTKALQLEELAKNTIPLASLERTFTHRKE